MQKFANLMWDEWITSLPERAVEEAEAESSGIMGSLYPAFSSRNVSLRSSRLWVFRRLRRIWPMTSWSSVIDLASMLRIPREMKGKVALDLPRDLYQIVVDERKNVLSGRNAWFWLRGVWGNTGSLYLPKGGHYMLFRSLDKDLIEDINNFLLKNNIKVSQRQKNGYNESILRDQDLIVTLLTRFRLYNSSLVLEQRTMIRAMRDRANKLVNCDGANIRKSLEAAQKQIEIATSLKDKGIYEDLPKALQEMIDLRLKYPSSTLTELGQFVEKPVSKSTVKYRWKKLQLLADQLSSNFKFSNIKPEISRGRRM